MLFTLPVKAQTDINAILSKISTAKDDTNKTNLYRDAIDYYKGRYPDSAFLLAEAGLKVAVGIRSSHAEAYMLWQMGVIDRGQGRSVTAKLRFNDALDIYQKLGEQKNVAIITNELGVIDGIKGNYDAATRQFFEALKIYESLGDTLGMGQSYIKLGAVNERLNNLDKASAYYDQAFKLSKSIGDSVNMAFVYNNMGILEGKREHNEQSFRYFQSGLAMCTSGKFTSVKISLLLNSGIVYERMGNEQAALERYDTALKIAREHNMQFDVPNILLNITLLDHVVNKQQKIPLLKEALQLAIQTDQKGLEVDIYRTLADVSFENGNYKDAYLYQDTCNNIEKSIFNVQKNKEIVNLETLYELDKSRNKVSKLELQNKERTFQKNAIIVFALIIMTALLIVIVFYRKTIKLNAELKAGKEELARANLVKDKMFSIIGHDLRTPTNSILGMLQILQMDNKAMSRDEEQEVYKMLKDQSVASLDTLNKLLLWGSRQIKGITLQLENFEVNSIIEGNIRLLQDNAAEKHLKLINKVPANVNIYADISHFDFIVRNLFSNGIKFSKNSGTIEIGIDNDRKDGFICFYVKDQGIGIKAEMREVIFSLNSLSRPGTDSEKGTGLGLVLCRDFVEQDGGKIWVESEEGKGSAFYFLMRVKV